MSRSDGVSTMDLLPFLFVYLIIFQPRFSLLLSARSATSMKEKGKVYREKGTYRTNSKRQKDYIKLNLPRCFETDQQHPLVFHVIREEVVLR